MKTIIILLLYAIVGCDDTPTPTIENGTYAVTEAVVESCCTLREGPAEARCTDLTRVDVDPATLSMTLSSMGEDRVVGAAGCTFTLEDQGDQLIMPKPSQSCALPDGNTTVTMRQLSIALRDDGSLVYEGDRLIDNHTLPYTCSSYAHYILERR